MPQKKFGFTLIELLVVISLIGIMAAVTIPIFGNFNRAQTLEQAVKNFKTDIRNSQNKSLSSVKPKSAELPPLPRAWGIEVALDEQGRASNYQVINCLRDEYFGEVLLDCITSETKNFPTNIVINSIKANGDDVPTSTNFYLVFDLLNGKAYYQSGGNLPDEVNNNNVLVQINYVGESDGPMITVGPGGMIQD